MQSPFVKRIFLLALLFPLTLRADDLIPLNDLGARDYHWGYIGGLWDNGGNEMDADHRANGLRRASLIQPLDADGKPSPNGKIVFIGAGFGETARIMCTTEAFSFDCEAGSLMSIAKNDPRVNHQSLVFVNAAREGYDASWWFWPFLPNYTRIKKSVLLPAGVTEKQVQVAWIQMVTNSPEDPPLPIQYADAYRLKAGVAQALRSMKEHYPNLQVAYLSSRVYGGYSTSNWNPEPYAYENGLTTRWMVVGQQIMMRQGGEYWDTRIGDLNYEKGIAPWIAWGPYLWANGTTPRSDGLTWQRDDFLANGESLSEQGAHKAASLLFDFLLHEPTATNWFLDPSPSTKSRVARH
jgi:hypothetical protein